jgi:hypothetical protein
MVDWHTMGSLFANGPLKHPIESLASHLASKHEADLCLAGTPYQSGICDT